MKLDLLTLHNDDMGSVVGDFHGTPIKAYYPETAEARSYLYLYEITRRSMEKEKERHAHNG
jgi:hypothetical protein